MATSQRAESFRGLLLRHRGRTGLTQRELAARAGVSRRTVQEWETGANYPGAERLEALIRVLLEAGGLTPGHEAAEAHVLWSAALDEAPRMRTPLDQAWLARLLAERATPAGAPEPARASIPAMPIGSRGEPRPVERRQDWGEAPDTVGFVDRTGELALLRHWVLNERCRLVALLGMGGIGKTSLAARVAQDVASNFERVYWRSLRDAPPVGEWLSGAIGLLSDRTLVPPSAESERIAMLLQLLRERRCLLVLDNSEALFEPGQREGRYRTGMTGYGRLLQAVGDASHQSCLVLTSREAPPELALLGGAARTFELGGFGADDAQVLLAPKQLEGTSQQWVALNARFGGNGLALKMVGESVRELFSGDIGAFLDEAGASGVFGGIRRLLTEQVDRSSALEQQVLRLLAVEREPLTIGQLRAEFGSSISSAAVLEAVEALRRRSLIERDESVGLPAFTLQSVVLEYVTDRLVEAVADEIVRGEPVVLVEHPLIKAQAKDYVRHAQERLIGVPILQRLNVLYGEEAAEQRLVWLLGGWRGEQPVERSYGPGNVVNLLRVLRGELRGLDLSNLVIRQAYLAGVEAEDASLEGAHLSEAVLADAFDLPTSVALSRDGSLLAAGTATGAVWLWRVADRRALLAVQGHTGGVWAMALSDDSQLLVSGGGDGAIRLWETSTGRLVAILIGHSGRVWGVALSASGGLLASGGGDGTVRVWETDTGRQVATLLGHTGGVLGVALSGDGHLVASGGGEGTVRLWEARTGQGLAILEGHTGGVWGVALSADAKRLVSGSADGTVRLWEAASPGDWRPLALLEGHSGTVWRVAISADGRLVASGSAEGTVRVWDAHTGRPLAILQGHTGGVRGVALSADGALVASGAGDGTVRLWEAASPGDWQQLALLQGHNGGVWGVALSADAGLLATGSAERSVQLWDPSTGRRLATLEGHTAGVLGVAVSGAGDLLASGGAEGTVRLWDANTRQPRAILRGHAGGVWAVALSADASLLASGSADSTVRVWKPDTQRLLAILEGHTGGIWGVALSADGLLLASGGEDGTVRLWETNTERLLATLTGHTGTVWGVALSASGDLVASGGEDATVRLWDSTTEAQVATLRGHTGTVWGVALSSDGRLLASGGEDGTVRLWETATGSPLATLQGHTGGVFGVALSANGQVLASGSLDGAVKVWDSTDGTCLRSLHAERRYERLDITGLTGVTSAQRAALLALGAIEHV